MLSYNDYSVFVCVNGKPVGYGGVKRRGIKTPFSHLKIVRSYVGFMFIQIIEV